MLRNGIKFGITLPTWDYNIRADSREDGGFPVDYKAIKNFASASEKLGYHSILVDDHLMRGKGGFILEGWTTLSSLVSITKKIRLGTMVLCNSFRYPSILAKMVATLDIISEGRVELGIGACSLEEEFIHYGIPLNKVSVRIEQLKEALEVMKKLWTDDVANYAGKYYNLKNAICEPKPLQKPHPPIIVGGSGKKLLRVVAQLADGCNFNGPPRLYKQRLKVLKKYCVEVGRDYDEIEKSWYGQVIISKDKKNLKKRIMETKPTNVSFEDHFRSNIIGSPEECLNKIKEYAKIGVTYFIISGFSRISIEELRLLKEVIDYL